MDQLVICALEQFFWGMEKLSQKRVDSLLATSFLARYFQIEHIVFLRNLVLCETQPKKA
jgi:hypothetical protein